MWAGGRTVKVRQMAPIDGCRTLAFSSQPRQRPSAAYVETLQTGNLLFLSGMLPVVDHKPKYVGRLGRELDAEAGRDAAYTAALSALAAAKQHLGSLDRVTRVVRLGVFMATSGDFYRPAQGRGRCVGSIPRCLRHRENSGSARDRCRQPSAGDADRTRSHLRSRRVSNQKM